MGEEGFEPPKAIASRFTACPLWPLGYSPLTSPNQGEYCTGRVGCDQRLSPEMYLAPGPPKPFRSGAGRKTATGRTRTVNLRFTKPLLGSRNDR